MLKNTFPFLHNRSSMHDTKVQHITPISLYKSDIYAVCVQHHQAHSLVSSWSTRFCFLHALRESAVCCRIFLNIPSDLLESLQGLGVLSFSFVSLVLFDLFRVRGLLQNCLDIPFRSFSKVFKVFEFFDFLLFHLISFKSANKLRL